MRDTFILPEKPSTLDTASGSNTKVAVVSIIGKSSYSSFGKKVKPLASEFVFNNEPKTECYIEGSYDEENQIIYLHLHSLLDTANLIEYYTALTKRCKGQNKNTDFLTIYNEVKNSFARALLFLFHISHIVILSEPGHSFDINYVQIFKSLDNIRLKCSSEITSVLQTVTNLSPDWISNGRPCTPRLVFYFERCPKQYKNPQKYPQLNIKKLEHEIEDRIYHILRKVRIVGSTSCNSLFAIPANQEYVYVNDSKDTNHDRLSVAVHNLIKSCQPGAQETLSFPYSCQSEAHTKSRNFHRFLMVHVDMAFTKGFDDNIGTGRHSSQAAPYFELPTIGLWFEVTSALYKYFFPKNTDSKPDEEDLYLQDSLIYSLYTDTKFSEQRCQKVLPLALARYQENLPSHYTRTHHETKLAMASGVFSMQARGPMFEKYSEELVEKCNKHFENGHQLCEYPSLTGNPCTNPKHDNDIEHCSGVRYVAACDCGRKQGSRDDPYTVKHGNYTFYQTLAMDCVCGNLERVKFPVFQPSTEEYRAANLFAGNTTTAKLAKSQEQMDSDKLSYLSQDSDILVPSKSEFSLAPQQENVTSQDNEIVLELLDEKDDTKGIVVVLDNEEKNLVRQPSTTEYLPGMLTSTSPPSLLPQFPSWSLVCLGASSLYSHNLGLSDNQHPGFLTGTNFLLPWDVTVRLEHSKPNWPAVNDTRKFQANIMRGRRTRPGGNLSHFVVKIFVGVEYECPRGHRFMLASPDKILRATSGIVKETGHKITNSDMPLYYNCPCRPNKPLVAQLMRIHVVSPKAPVYVTLNPKVQPAAGAPIFVPKVDGPVHISQSAYWVLRLPYVYASDRETFVASRQTVETAPKLLSGMWGVAESEVS